MHNQTIAELAKGLRAGEFSSVELTQAFLNRIDQYQALNCYITVTAEGALAQAQAADKRLAEGRADLLTDIPIAQKDIFCTEGVKTSCASKMLDNFISPYNATVVERFKLLTSPQIGIL